MANLVELVKQAALDAVSAAHPTQVVFGKVTALDPLEVRIHQQLLLTREFLVLSEGIRTKAAQGTLHAGDTLLLLQQQGGQSFLALDILPGADWELPPEEPVTWADIAEKPEIFPPAAHMHTAQEVGAAEASHTHSAAEIASGTLPLARGGTGAATARTNLGFKTTLLNSTAATGTITLKATNGWSGGYRFYIILVSLADTNNPVSGIVLPREVITSSTSGTVWSIATASSAKLCRVYYSGNDLYVAYFGYQGSGGGATYSRVYGVI